MPGARCARSLAWCVKNTRVSHHGHTGIARHSPRNGFNGFLRALPGDRALSPSDLIWVCGEVEFFKKFLQRGLDSQITDLPVGENQTIRQVADRRTGRRIPMPKLQPS